MPNLKLNFVFGLFIETTPKFLFELSMRRIFPSKIAPLAAPTPDGKLAVGVALFRCLTRLCDFRYIYNIRHEDRRHLKYLFLVCNIPYKFEPARRENRVPSRLRGIEEKDLVSIRSWRKNRELLDMVHGLKYPTNEAMQRRWFDQKVMNGSPTTAIFAIQSDDGHIAGVCQLVEIVSIHQRGKLGIYIGSEDSRGLGLGEQALRELLRFGFDDLNLRKIWLEVTSINSPAIRLYKKVGFQTEGVLRQHYFSSGKFENVDLMSLLLEEYQRIRQLSL